MPHHQYHSSSRRSQAQKLRRIELSRKGKRMLKRLLVAVVVALVLAVALSYVFVKDQEAPENLEIPEKGFRGLF